MMPVLGIIYLRHAYSRYLAVKAKVEPTLPTRGGARLPLTKDHLGVFKVS
jgi:type I restriction enzyme M protein